MTHILSLVRTEAWLLALSNVNKQATITSFLSGSSVHDHVKASLLLGSSTKMQGTRWGCNVRE